MTKYESIARTHLFCPIAIETSGVFVPDASAILHNLARRIKDVSSEQNSRAYLFNFCCGAERLCSICHGVCWFVVVIYVYSMNFMFFSFCAFIVIIL